MQQCECPVTINDLYIKKRILKKQEAISTINQLKACLFMWQESMQSVFERGEAGMLSLRDESLEHIIIE